MTIMGGIAEFERSLIRKRCEEGIERASERARNLAGRPRLIRASDVELLSAMPQVRPWQSWRATMSAVRPRFGGRCSRNWAGRDRRVISVYDAGGNQAAVKLIVGLETFSQGRFIVC